MPSDLTTIQRGQAYEQIAEDDFLKRFSSAACVGQNLRFKIGELDRVFSDGVTLHFVEVRGRVQDHEDVETVFPRSKKTRWRQTVRLFLRDYAGKETHLRLWLALVSGELSTARIEWFESVVE